MIAAQVGLTQLISGRHDEELQHNVRVPFSSTRGHESNDYKLVMEALYVFSDE